jgi:alpha-1,2-mannosyltransferase
VSVARLRIAAVKMGTWLGLGVAPVALAVIYGWVFISRGPGHSDFWTFWLAGRTVLHGGDPYPLLASLPDVADKWFAPFVYPPVAAYLLAPVAVLPFALAKVVFFLLNMVGVVVALRLLGVRDWRCYSAAFASPPVVEAVGIGTISIPLLLMVAAAWRWRAHTVRAGLLVACAVTAKLFLWPVWFWLVRARRYRAAALAVCASLVAVVVSWAAIGFAGLHDYPALLNRMTALEGPHSYSVYSLQRVFGVGDGAAARAGYALGAAALVLTLRFVRGDRRTLAALLGVSLLATPILWPHYLVLLFVPIAFASRRFSWLWLMPVALWADATGWSHGHAWRIVGELAVCAVVVGAALLPRRLADGQRGVHPELVVPREVADHFVAPGL